jgi:L-fucose isomerase and related proteins
MKPDFAKLAATKRGFTQFDSDLVGPVTTIAITPVADGRIGAFEENAAKTWRMAEKVYDLVTKNIVMPDGRPVRVVVAPEIVYGPRSGAVAQAFYAKEGVCANIWVARSWCYSDELMSACQGIGSSEWQQAAWGLNQTDRPGAVWLKAFCSAMDEKKRPIFSIYSPDLEDEDAELNDFVSTRLLRFARAAAAVGYIRGKNYLGIGGVSMGIIGSDIRRNQMLEYFGMGSVSFDMSGINTRINAGFYDKEEVDKAFAWFKKSYKMDFGAGKRPLPPDELLYQCARMTVIVKDLMRGNPKLAAKNVEWAQGYNAVGAGTQGQRQWTDGFPNYDVAESCLNSLFDWNGPRPAYTVATENDSKNGVGMIIANAISGGMSQLFADIRTNWTPASIKKATGVDVSKICPRGIIDKRNSGAGALEYAVDLYKLAGVKKTAPIAELVAKLRAKPELHAKAIAAIQKNTTYMAAALTYFPGDGLSSHYTSPGGLPMTAYRYNMVGDKFTASIVEGETVELPKAVAQHISQRTDPTWPETYWTPFGMSSFEYMDKIGPNHDGNSLGLIGADLITFNAMLRIPVDMHNIAATDIFRPTLWNRFGGDDFRACDFLGPVYG